jgi:hypothetical protein
VGTSDGYNLSDDGSCSTILNSTTDSNSVTAAGLDSKGLQNNGGLTNTIALLPTSPAVDGVPTADCTLSDGTTPVATDERSTNRPQGAACDIGAFELVQSAAFASFNAKLDIDGRSFRLNSTFTLGAGSSGIDPLTQSVTLKVGTYAATIPAGSFQQMARGEQQGSYWFSGVIDGASLWVRIVPLGENGYELKAEGAPVDFSGLQNPVTVSLSIGSTTGTASVYVDGRFEKVDFESCRHHDEGCSRHFGARE